MAMKNAALCYDLNGWRFIARKSLNERVELEAAAAAACNH